MVSNENQKPTITRRRRLLYVGVFSILSCCSAWMTARGFTLAAAAERLAKSGHETSFRTYQVDAMYPIHFAVTVGCVVMSISMVCRAPGPLLLREPSSVFVVAVQVGPIAFAAVQMLMRTGNQMCASGASYAHSLDSILTCDDSETSLSTPNYAKMMAFSAKEWGFAFFILTMFAAIPIIFSWRHARAKRNSQEQLDEKAELSC